MNIVFHNTKGSVGKTTAATFVAQMLARDYDTKNIRFIDLDNIQYSLHWFMNLRKKNNLDYIQTLTKQSKIDGLYYKCYESSIINKQRREEEDTFEYLKNIVI